MASPVKISVQPKSAKLTPRLSPDTRHKDVDGEIRATVRGEKVPHVKKNLSRKEDPIKKIL
jgi:hypothetical protein